MEVILVTCIVSTFIFYKLFSYIDNEKKQVKEVKTITVGYSEETLTSLSDIIDALENVIELLDTALSYLSAALSSGIIDRMDANIFLNIGKYEAVEVAATYVQQAQSLMDEIGKEATSMKLDHQLSFSLIELLDDIILENKVMKDISIYKISKQAKKLLKQLERIEKVRNQLVLQYNTCIRKKKTR